MTLRAPRLQVESGNHLPHRCGFIAATTCPPHHNRAGCRGRRASLHEILQQDNSHPRREKPRPPDTAERFCGYLPDHARMPCVPPAVLITQVRARKLEHFVGLLWVMGKRLVPAGRSRPAQQLHRSAACRRERQLPDTFNSADRRPCIFELAPIRQGR